MSNETPKDKKSKDEKPRLPKLKVRIDLSCYKAIIFQNATYKINDQDVIEVYRGEGLIAHYDFAKVFGVSNSDVSVELETPFDYEGDIDDDWLDDMDESWDKS